MKKIIIISSFLLFASLSLQAQKNSKSKSPKDQQFGFMFYNTENLFDTIDTPNKKDEEYTPKGRNLWTSDKYNKKVSNIAKVISSISPSNFPSIIGLTEIENKAVLEDLLNTNSMKKVKYQIVHEESPDERGIDCALLYRPEEFKYISHKAINVTFSFDSAARKTRDILYVKGVTNSNDTLNIFVNHWSSRGGGKEKSEPKRIFTAEIMRHYVDSLFDKNINANIILMGDFNDDPTDKSTEITLKTAANVDVSDNKKLVNLLYNKFKAGEGTLPYKGSWNLFDQIFVSPNLITKKTGYKINPSDISIFKPEWLTKKDEKGNLITIRTYDKNSPNEVGFSDHLPVYIYLNKK
ncbi:MAG: endonuclease/exonuclease/phosphatase family protein [Bacteroidetes bacterium]|nr:endonuclease/exonuclease/phosphatase family protein [Bacteroidota bacterium]